MDEDIKKMSNNELNERVGEGSMEALEEMLLRYKGYIIKQVNSRMNNKRIQDPHVAEEIYNNIYLRMLGYIKKGKKIRSFFGLMKLFMRVEIWKQIQIGHINEWKICATCENGKPKKNGRYSCKDENEKNKERNHIHKDMHTCLYYRRREGGVVTIDKIEGMLPTKEPINWEGAQNFLESVMIEAGRKISLDIFNIIFSSKKFNASEIAKVLGIERYKVIYELNDDHQWLIDTGYKKVWKDILNYYH